MVAPMTTAYAAPMAYAAPASTSYTQGYNYAPVSGFGTQTHAPAGVI